MLKLKSVLSVVLDNMYWIFTTTSSQVMLAQLSELTGRLQAVFDSEPYFQPLPINDMAVLALVGKIDGEEYILAYGAVTTYDENHNNVDGSKHWHWYLHEDVKLIGDNPWRPSKKPKPSYSPLDMRVIAQGVDGDEMMRTYLDQLVGLKREGRPLVHYFSDRFEMMAVTTPAGQVQLVVELEPDSKSWTVRLRSSLPVATPWLTTRD